MNKKNKLFNIRYSDLFIVFVYFFFVWLQYYKISNLNLGYLGESLSFSIVPYYTLGLLLIPIIVFVFMYIPGLFIVTIEFRVPIKHFSLLVNNICIDFKAEINYFIKSIFEKRYRVLRC